MEIRKVLTVGTVAVSLTLAGLAATLSGCATDNHQGSKTESGAEKQCGSGQCGAQKDGMDKGGDHQCGGGQCGADKGSDSSCG